MVRFIPEGHKYLNESGQQYISVTTLISRYKSPFDSEYWATYKALKLVLERDGTWVSFKKRAGGWDKAVQSYRSINHVKKDEIETVKKRFLHNWEQTGKVAREVGTEYHKKMEEQIKGPSVLQQLQPGEVRPAVTHFDLIGDGVFAEVLIFNDKYRLAGTADKVTKEGMTVDIGDYKTSREIEYEAFQDERLHLPLRHVPACNYWEYSLQLSIYAWMLEQQGFTIGKLWIEHVPDNHRIHPVKYLKKEVINLLEHYEASKDIHNAGFPKKGGSPMRNAQ